MVITLLINTKKNERGNKMGRLRITTLLAWMLLCVSSAAIAESVDICTESINMVHHPAQYVTRQIRRHGLVLCIAHPACCSPVWATDPICYITRRRQISQAFDEAVSSLHCEKKSAEIAITEFIDSWTKPIPIIAGPGLMLAYNNAVDLNLASASPLPSDVIDNLKRLIGSPGIPFKDEDVESARWKKASDPLAAPLFPGTYGDKHTLAITHGNLIIVRDNITKLPKCTYYAKWAHEITHVYQNRKDGKIKFLDKYLTEGGKKDYEKISYEIEASKVENLVLNSPGCANM